MTTVLVVDDEILLSNILAEVLSQQGYHVRTAGNGREALDAIVDGSVAPDLILLDIKMPVMNGPEFLTASRSLIPTMPIIIVSAELKPFDMLPADPRIGAVLEKPFDLNTLLKTVTLFTASPT